MLGYSVAVGVIGDRWNWIHLVVYGGS